MKLIKVCFCYYKAEDEEKYKSFIKDFDDEEEQLELRRLVYEKEFELMISDKAYLNQAETYDKIIAFMKEMCFEEDEVVTGYTIGYVKDVFQGTIKEHLKYTLFGTLPPGVPEREKITSEHDIEFILNEACYTSGRKPKTEEERAKFEAVILNLLCADFKAQDIIAHSDVIWDYVDKN